MDPISDAGTRATTKNDADATDAVNVRRYAHAAAAVAATLFVAALQVHRIDDGDTWWHLASGRLIATTHAVAHTDPFSFTAHGAPWVNRQWLFDLTAYAAWRAGGAAGVALAAGAMFLAGFGGLLALACRRLPTWAAAALVYVAAQAAVERFTIRPEAVTFAFLALYLLVLDRRRIGAGTVALLLAAQVAWANAHALSILGVVVIASELAGSAAALWLPFPEGWRRASARDGRSLAALAVATIGGLVAEAATPFGVTGAIFPLRLFGVLRGAEVTSRTIIEHRPPVLAELSPPAAAGFVALLVLAVVATAVSWRRWRLSHLLVAGGFVTLALLARRNVALVAPGCVPLVAAGLGAALATLDARRPRLVAALSITIALGLALETARVVSGRYYESARLTRVFGLGVSSLLFPAGALAYLDAALPDARIFNDDGLGGYIIWQSRRPVFVDDRLQVYPASVYGDYQTVLDDPRRFPLVAARYGITAAILYHPAPGRLELAGAIAHVPGWRVRYLDAGAVILAPGGDDSLPAGLHDSIPDRDPEAALLHYQRGRAALYLLGSKSFDAARADFSAALAISPSLDEARVGLRAIANVRN
ncbi:MAG TPA: hypothetical protein VKU61_03280 [Candidatus Binatia bacterium]|nr:hypothetical protein [Candidatus Binatia bacterium]